MIFVTAASDFVLESTKISFPAGQTSASVSFTAVDNLIAELTETLQIELINPSPGVAIGADNTATVTINDDDSELEEPLTKEGLLFLFSFCRSVCAV